MHDGSFPAEYQFELKERFPISVSGERYGTRLLEESQCKASSAVERAYASNWFQPAEAGTYALGVYECTRSSLSPRRLRDEISEFTVSCEPEDIVCFLRYYRQLLPIDGATVFMHRPFRIPRGSDPTKKRRYSIAFYRRELYATRYDLHFDPCDPRPRRYYIARCP